MQSFSQLQNRAAQVAKYFDVTMEEAWEKIHGWIDRELGLSQPTVQKIDGALVAIAQDVEARVVEEVVSELSATDLAKAAQMLRKLIEAYHEAVELASLL